MRRSQAYRPSRPTPLEATVALAGLVVAAAIVICVAWIGLVALLTYGEQLRRALP